MKKILLAAVLSALTIVSVGCSDSSKGGAADQLEKGAPVEDAEPTDNISSDLKARERSIETDGKFVYDDDKILSDGEYEALNSYTAWFAKAFKMNAAVVLTKDIGDSDPDEYAENFYNDNYDGDGLLFLINNDTNEDYIYRSGSVEEYLTDDKVDMLFPIISPMLAMEKYVSAAERVMEEAELSIPEYISDRSHTLDKDLMTECNDMLKDASGDNTLNLYYVLGTGNEKMEKFAKKRFDSFFEKDSDTALLVVDGENGENYLVASGTYSFMTEAKFDLEKDIKSCYKKTKGLDVKKATEIFIKYARGEGQS